LRRYKIKSVEVGVDSARRLHGLSLALNMLAEPGTRGMTPNVPRIVLFCKSIF